MIIKNFYIRIIWKFLIAITATTGIAISFGLGYGKFFPKMLFFFTILSAILVAIYFWVDSIMLVRNYCAMRSGGASSTVEENRTGGSSHTGEENRTSRKTRTHHIIHTDLDWEPAFALKHTALFGIILTGVIANTLLSGQMQLQDWRDIWVDILLHKVTPIMVFLDFIFCEKHGNLKFSHPFLSIIFPLIYFICTEIFVNVLQIDMNENDVFTRYPYLFLDPDIYGIRSVVTIISVIIFAFLVTGAIFFAIDKLLAKLCK